MKQKIQLKKREKSRSGQAGETQGAGESQQRGGEGIGEGIKGRGRGMGVKSGVLAETYLTA